jgi:hypothetical protein
MSSVSDWYDYEHSLKCLICFPNGGRVKTKHFYTDHHLKNKKLYDAFLDLCKLADIN